MLQTHKAIKTGILKRCFCFVFILVSSLASASPVFQANKSDKPATPKNTAFTQAQNWLSKQPVEFLENKGQFRDMDNNPVPFVLFKAEAPGVDLYITEKGLTYVFVNKVEDEEENESPVGSTPSPRHREKIKLSTERLDMELPGANILKENISKEDTGIARYNYLTGSVSKAVYGVKKYWKITISNIYPGIDWVLYNSNSSGFKYDFIVHPGADPQNIRLLYKSINKLKLNADGSLNIKTHTGTLNEKAPYTYLAENRNELKSRFKILSETKESGIHQTLIGFDIATRTEFNKEQTLVIDPQLVWATFYGGTAADGTQSIETDGAGNCVMIGYTTSSNFPLQNNGGFFQTNFVSQQAFILKFSNTGTLLWSTFFGPSGTILYDLAIDQNNNLFVCGLASASTFPLQNSGGYYQSSNGGPDAFITRFNSLGNIVWSSFYGGSGIDWGQSLAIDQNNNVFMAGQTNSANFPTQNASTYFESSLSGSLPGFIVKFNNNGSRLWATYLKGISYPTLAVDLNNNVYVAARSNTLIPLLNPGGTSYYQGSYSGANDGSILKFDNSGNLLWGTYYGGNLSDEFASLTTDKAGNVLVLGRTTSTNLPVQNAGTYFQGSIAGPSGDLFLAKFDNSGTRLWGTYFGGTNYESFYDYDNMALDTCGNFYIGCTTLSRNIPIQSSCDAGFNDASMDTSVNTNNNKIYLAYFSNGGNLLWSTYFGGDGNDFRTALATDNAGNLFVTGEWAAVTNTLSYPLVNPGGGAYSSGFQGGDDSFIARFQSTQIAPPPGSLSYTGSICKTNSLSVSPVTSSNNISGGTYSSNPGLSINATSGIITPSLSNPGTYTVTYSGSKCNCIQVQAITTTVTIYAPGTVSINSPTVCAGNSSTLTASTGTGSTATFTWLPGGIAGNSLVVSTTSNSTYTVLVNDNHNCAYTATTSLSIYPQPSLSVMGKDTICRGAATTLTASGANTYTWSTGANSASVSLNPNLNTNFTVVASDSNGCRDSVYVFIVVKPVPIISANNVSVCAGQSATLYATGVPPSGINYTWQPGGATTSSALVNSPASGIYTVYADLDGCLKNTTVNLTVNNQVVPVTSFNYEGPYCVHGTTAAPIEATGFNTSGLFYSEQGLNLDVYSGIIDLSSSSAGTFVVSYSVSAQSCSLAGGSSATVIINPAPVLHLTPAIELTPGTGTVLNLSGGSSYTWSPARDLSCVNCANPIASPAESTQYCVLASEKGCLSETCVTIDVTCTGKHNYSMPNAFTPNGDGENDAFCLQGWSLCVKDFSILIFDRWGENVYQSTNPDFCWDGIYKGQVLSPDVYVYIVNASYSNDKKITKKGNITLIR